MVDVDKLKPINKSLLVLRCKNASAGNIVLPDFLADRSTYAEVIRVSDDCELFSKEHEGQLVKLKPNGPEGTAWYPNDMKNVVDEYFIVRERLVDHGLVGAVYKE